MEEFIRKALEKQQVPQDVDELFIKVKDLVELSRSKMSNYYDMWDRIDDLSKNRRRVDEADRRAQERKEPVKMVVPLTSAQIDTFVSFAYMMFTQREVFFEMFGGGSEDYQAAKFAEALLQRDLEESNFLGYTLSAFLNNVAKFNLGVVKHGWVEDTVYQEAQPTMQEGPDGMMVPNMQEAGEMTQEVVFAGNKIINVSPYRFFPDPRFPVSRFQEGEFCASEDDFSPMRMKRLVKDGVFAGVEHVNKISQELLTTRRTTFDQNIVKKGGLTNIEDNFIVTEIEVELIPEEHTIDGTKLGDEDYPVKFLINYANDDRIVSIERQGYAHGNFLYRIGQYSPDDNELIGESLPGLLDKLQDAVSWFINSRITSVRKVIDNRLVVDPRGIDVRALKKRDPILFLKPEAQGGDVRRYLQQLQVSDVTSGNLNDVSVLSNLAKEATGLNENLIGQFSPGRRSAAESRMVNNSAVSRIKRIIDGIWHTTLKPLAKDMVANHRAFLDAEQLIQVYGLMEFMNPEVQQGAQQFMNVSKAQLHGNYDVMVYDGTLPSQREVNASGLQELLNVVMQSPEMAMQMGIGPNQIKLIFKEIIRLRGLKNVDRFFGITQNAGFGQPGGAPQGSTPAQAAAGQPMVSPTSRVDQGGGGV